MQMKQWIADIIQFGGFLFVFLGLWLNWRSQRAQTAIAFFSRFDQIVTTDKSNLFRIDDRPRRLTGDALKTARRYFNLCSEEFNLNQRRYIPNDIWKIWRCGIEGILQDRLWRASWKKVRKEYDSYPAFVEFIDEFAMPNPSTPGTKQR
jgi:hypothetical protein